MKNYLYRPPAFKSDVGEKPTEGENKDLYLKGQDYYSGRAINFEEEIIGTGGRVARSGERWQLDVFKSGATRITDGGGEHADDDIECGKDWFIVEKPTYEGEGHWSKAVAKVTFKLDNCTDIAKGRKECDIEIAEEKFILKKKISFLSL